MAAFIAKQMMGNQLNAVKGKSRVSHASSVLLVNFVFFGSSFVNGAI